MTKERFTQLWNALIRDALKTNRRRNVDPIEDTGCSPVLKKALIDAERDGTCLAERVPNELNKTHETD